MVSIKSIALVTLSLSSFTDAQRRNRGGRNRGGNGGANGGGATQQLTSQEQAAQIPGGISEATDGSTILDTTETVK